MFELMNQVAPEHLEIAMDDAYSYLDQVENAGSVFLGHYTSEPINAVDGRASCRERV